MSYEIVKGIKIRDNKVFIKASSNNVYPKTFDYEECESLSRFLAEKGEQELKVEIFKQFEEGNFQASNGFYARALKVLYYVFGEEYKLYSWRARGETEEQEKEREERRKSQAFKDLLLKALNTKLPKQKFIVKKNDYYVFKTTRRYIKYSEDISRAKKFDFRQQAESIAEHIKGEVLEFKQQSQEPKKLLIMESQKKMKLINPVGEVTRYKDKEIFSLLSDIRDYNIFIDKESQQIDLRQNAKYPINYTILKPSKKVLKFFESKILESQEEQKKAIGNDTARDNQASKDNITPHNQTIGEPTK
jgi:hypothetical protein